MTPDTFISRWQHADGCELANAQSKGFDDGRLRARVQAEKYARIPPAEEGSPVDVVRKLTTSYEPGTAAVGCGEERTASSVPHL